MTSSLLRATHDLCNRTETFDILIIDLIDLLRSRAPHVRVVVELRTFYEVNDIMAFDLHEQIQTCMQMCIFRSHHDET